MVLNRFDNGLSIIRLLADGGYIGIASDGTTCYTGKEHAEEFEFTDWGFGSIFVKKWRCTDHQHTFHPLMLLSF